LERAISLETPSSPQKIGKQNIATKASIFPPRVAVIAGRAISTLITTALKRIRLKIRIVAWSIGSDPSQAAG
jgi:hypothetical protein